MNNFSFICNGTVRELKNNRSEISDNWLNRLRRFVRHRLSDKLVGNNRAMLDFHLFVSSFIYGHSLNQSDVHRYTVRQSLTLSDDSSLWDLLRCTDEY